MQKKPLEQQRNEQLSSKKAKHTSLFSFRDKNEQAIAIAYRFGCELESIFQPFR